MPIYTLHTDENGLDAFDFINSITLLHSQTFRTERAEVRVEVVIAPRVNGNQSRHAVSVERHVGVSLIVIRNKLTILQGGIGFQPSAGRSGMKKTTEYLTVQIDFRDSAALWEAYCTRIVRLRPSIRSIYLQKLEFEFERRDPNYTGKIITPSREDPQASAAFSSPPPPVTDEPLPPYQLWERHNETATSILENHLCILLWPCTTCAIYLDKTSMKLLTK